MNQVTISVRLTSDPEYIQTPKSTLCKFFGAHERNVNKHGQQVKQNDIWKFEGWGKEVDYCRDLQKDDVIFVTGILRQEHWVDQHGQARSTPFIRLIRFDGPLNYVQFNDDEEDDIPSYHQKSHAL